MPKPEPKKAPKKDVLSSPMANKNERKLMRQVEGMVPKGSTVDEVYPDEKKRR
jgi:hypothetical protein